MRTYREIDDTDPKQFLEALHTASIPSFEVLQNIIIDKIIISNTNEIIKLMRKNKEKTPADLTRKLLDLFISARDKQDPVYYLMIGMFLEMLHQGVLPGYLMSQLQMVNFVSQCTNKILNDKKQESKIYTPN